MHLQSTHIHGVHLVRLEELSDERGFFARSFCRSEFETAGLEPAVAQCNISFNHRAGTLRGLHYQTMAAPETKLVRCTRGAIVDVVVDMRAGSPTLGQHVSAELTAENRTAIYVPAGFAHGYLTLRDDTEVHYQVSHPYTPNTERGLLHDDALLGIDWTRAVEVISAKDLAWEPLASVSDLEQRADEAANPTLHADETGDPGHA